MEDVKVSVIIAVYNTAPYLRECLDSIMNQTLREIEIICVDDGSSDGSVDILKEYQKNDSRLRVLEKEHTGNGAAGARNAGLEIAKGKWLSILDSDDRFDPKLLEKAFLRGEKQQADIVMYDAWRLDDATGRFFGLDDVMNPSIIPQKEIFNREDIADDLFSITIGAAWSIMLRHNFVRKNNLKFQPVYHADDLFFTYSALALAERITAVRERLLYYRFNTKNSQTANKTSNPLSAPMAWGRLGQWLREQGLFDLLSTAFYNRAAFYCKWYLDTVRTVESYELLYDALQREWLQKLGLDQCGREVFFDVRYYEWCQQIQKMSCKEYLFKEGYFSRHPHEKKESFQYKTLHLFPSELVSKGETVVLYGAGNVGSAWYIQNLLRGYCNITAWVDARFEEISAPVESPDILYTLNFDKLLIGIENPETVKAVKKKLEENGIDMCKVFWKELK